MMELVMFSVYDKAVGAYMRPFFMQSDGQALRAFIDDCTAADSPVASHPEDYALFRVGRWYDSEGTLVPEEPVCIGRAHELVAQSREVHPGQFDAFEKRVNGTSDSDSEELR
jgi:hypothetical protein